MRPWTFVRPGRRDHLELADRHLREMIECPGREAIVGRDGDREEAAIVRDDGAVFLEGEQDGFLLPGPARRDGKVRAQAQPLAHGGDVWVLQFAAGGVMRRRVNGAEARPLYHSRMA